MPRDVPELNRVEAAIYGADVTLVDGLISDAGRLIRELAPASRLVRRLDAQGAVPPGRQEDDGHRAGRAGRLGRGLPARRHRLSDRRRHRHRRHAQSLRRARSAGLDRPSGDRRWSSSRPRAARPIVRAFQTRRALRRTLGKTPRPVAAGLRVPVAIGDYLILDAVRDTGGTALAVSEDAIREAQLEMGRLAGVYAAPEAAATWAATSSSAPERLPLRATSASVLFCTGMGLKYPTRLRTPYRSARSFIRRSQCIKPKGMVLAQDLVADQAHAMATLSELAMPYTGSSTHRSAASSAEGVMPARSWPKIRHSGGSVDTRPACTACCRAPARRPRSDSPCWRRRATTSSRRGLVFPGHERHGHDRRLGDLALGAVLDVARPRVMTVQRIGRPTGDAAQVQALDAQRVANPKDQADVGQAAHVVEDDADRRPRQLAESGRRRACGRRARAS